MSSSAPRILCERPSECNDNVRCRCRSRRRCGTPFARLAARFRTTGCRNGGSAIVDGDAVAAVAVVVVARDAGVGGEELAVLAVLVAVVAGRS